jgi:hypothetical protein
MGSHARYDAAGIGVFGTRRPSGRSRSPGLIERTLMGIKTLLARPREDFEAMRFIVEVRKLLGIDPPFRPAI